MRGEGERRRWGGREGAEGQEETDRQTDMVSVMVDVRSVTPKARFPPSLITIYFEKKYNC